MELCPGACDGSVLVVPDSSKGVCVRARGMHVWVAGPFGSWEQHAWFRRPPLLGLVF